MKKLWKYRYYALTGFGYGIVCVGTQFSSTKTGLILWCAGIQIAFVGVALQIAFAPNFKK